MPARVTGPVVVEAIDQASSSAPSVAVMTEVETLSSSATSAAAMVVPVMTIGGPATALPGSPCRMPTEVPSIEPFAMVTVPV